MGPFSQDYGSTVLCILLPLVSCCSDGLDSIPGLHSCDFIPIIPFPYLTQTRSPIQVKECYGKGAKLTVTDSNGWTPLHHAARLGKKEVVQYLVENSTCLVVTGVFYSSMWLIVTGVVTG